MADAILADSPIGRRHQRDRLREWVAQLALGRGRAVLVEGEPGIGKSSMIRTAAAEAVAAGCQVLWASCDELSQAFPLLPLLDALDSGQGASRLTSLSPDAAAPGNRVDLTGSAAERLLALVDEHCARSPLMLVVDDLQWADAATVLTLGRLTRAVRQVPLLLVAAVRPLPRREDVLALRRMINSASVLSLRSLDGDEVVDLLTEVLGAPPGPRLLGMAAGAAGNPLYLTELVDALTRGGGLVPGGERIDAAAGDPPESLTEAITDRLEFLATPVREVLRLAALLGQDFSVSELAVVSGHGMSELMPVLDDAILAGLVLDNGTELAFRHPMIRTALYEGMPTAVRMAWHRSAARALARDGSPAERVARQLLPTFENGEPSGPVDDWVVQWLAGAGAQLVAQAPQVANPLLRWAMDGIPTGVAPYDVLASRLADGLYRAGDPAGAAEVAAAALPHVRRADLLVDLHWTLTQCRAVDGRCEEALDGLRRAMQNPGVGPEHRARLMVLTARAYRHLGQVDDAARYAGAALDAASEAGDRWATGWALGTLTIVHGMRGEADKALPLYDRALAVVEGDPALTDLRLLLQINQAVALGDLDRYDDAISTAQQVRQLADESGNVVRLAQAQCALGELLFDVGRWDDALAEVDPDGEVFRDPTVACGDHGVAATIQLHRGDPDAERHLQDAQRYANRLGGRVVGSLAMAKSLEREHADAPDEALAVLLEWLDPVEDIDETADLLADGVRLALAIGDRGTAGTLVSRAEEVSRNATVPHLRAVGPHCRGLLDRDATALLRAAQHYQAAGRPLPRAQALEAAGVTLADAGDIAGARNHFTTAFSVYSGLSAGWDLARTQATFRRYGIRRGPRVRHRSAHQGWNSLTPTELKVAGLVAQGMSNPQIATHLFLSRRTVQTHVSHILAKLSLNSRIDIAREASRREAE